MPFSHHLEWTGWTNNSAVSEWSGYNPAKKKVTSPLAKMIDSAKLDIK